MRQETAIIYITEACLCILFSLLAACPTMGQALCGKRTLTAEDYRLWSTPELGSFSRDGKWLSYALHYEQGQDTLFVRATGSEKQFIFPGALSGEFRNNLFAAVDEQGRLQLIHLNQGSSKTYRQVMQYNFTASGELLLLHSGTDTAKRVTLIDSMANVRWSKKALGMYAGPAGHYVAVTRKDTTGNTMELIRLRDLKTVFTDKGNAEEFVNLAWNKKASVLAYMRKNSTDGSLTLHCYDVINQQLFTLNPHFCKDIPQGQFLSHAALTLSDDGAAVFFRVGDKKADTGNSDQQVQVWNTADKWLYPKEKYVQGWKAVDKICVWYPGRQQVLQITDALLPKCFLSGDYRYAVLHNPQTYEPQTELQAKTDYYIMNLHTGKKSLLLRKHSGSPLHLMALPESPVLVYFRKKNWWSYNPGDGTHHNITAGIPKIAATSDMQEDLSPLSSPFKIAGKDQLLITASGGLWIVGIYGKKPKCLTPVDRERKYQVAAQAAALGKQGNIDGITAARISLDKPVYIAVKSPDGSASGYGQWYRGKYSQLLYGQFFYSDLKVSDNSNAIACLQEDYNLPPELKILRQGSPPATLLRTNTQHYLYHWGHADLIHYNAGGKRLSGALYYPAGYDPGREYPMVVHIYEKQSEKFREYINPTLLDACGFNVTVLTAKGYFVLLPDIAYSYGQPGPSALHCVQAATDKAIRTACIDSQRMGLIGHSFGGYQANYIATHTDRFAAVVSGSAINDLVRGYLTVGNYKVPDYWRYEHHQMRMGRPLFDDIKAYLDNSPVFAAASLNTPLLSWTGDQDYQVDWHQSVEFFLALRRLGKPHTLLIYPGESHALYRDDHKEDLSRRILDFLDRYLNNSAASQ